VDKARHLALARLALARGIVNLEGYSQAVIRLMNAQGAPSLEELWEGVATEAQIEDLRKAASVGDGETMSGFFQPDEGNTTSQLTGTFRGGAPVSAPLEDPEVITAISLDPRKTTDAEAATPAQERYHFVEDIGRGGMGFVRLAYDHSLSREVALKTLRPERAADSLAQEVFLAEARVTGQLEHPQIVPVHDLGVLPSGELYYTMKRVRGTDLSRIINGLIRNQDPELSKRFTLYRLVSIFVQACQGIAYAHAQGVLHRDIKPANIMVGDFAEVLVLDWGLALRYTAISEAERRRQTGRAVGTPGYMAPEQAAGELDKMGPPADVFSLGAVLYELLTLTPLVAQDNPRAVIRRIAKDAFEPPRRRAPERSIPGALEALCMWALEKRPEDRPRNAAELAEELIAFQEGSKERARKREEATQRETQGRALAQQYRSLHDEALRTGAEAEAALEAIDPLAPPEEKRLLWQKADEARALEAEENRVFSEAVRMFSQALSHDPEHRSSRSALAELYLARLMAIEERGGSPEEVELMRQLAATYDDGRLAARLSGDGAITLLSDPSGAQATLYRYEERDRVLRPIPLEDLGGTPIASRALPMGSYLVSFRSRGSAPAVVPFRLDRCSHLELKVRMHRAERVIPGFAYIPGGAFWAHGGNSRPQSVEALDGFCMQVLPITLGEYLEFLSALGTDAEPHFPRRGGSPFIRRAPDGALQLNETALFLEANPAEWLSGTLERLPIFGVSSEDALAYAAWRSAREGVELRLPTALEWEKAARGTDGRLYPWGNSFDPTFCKHRDARREGIFPEPVGSFPLDESPYGVRDCAGGVAEWMFDGPTPERRYARGGSWDGGLDACRLTHRTSLLSQGRYRGVGFRLVYALK
jgi:serine/threonine-protein kinase